MTPNPDALVAVNQADREAAADLAMLTLVAAQGQQPWMAAACDRLRRGEVDNSDEVQAFARHRLAALADQRDERGGVEARTDAEVREEAIAIVQAEARDMGYLDEDVAGMAIPDGDDLLAVQSVERVIGLALASPPAPEWRVPEGWVAVPVVLTNAMVESWEGTGCPSLAGMDDAQANRAVAQADWSALLAASPPLPASGGAEWQPIENAPRDRTWFDVWVPSFAEPGKGYRVPDLVMTEGGTLFRVGETHPVRLAHWPTHWRPRPSPPATDRQEIEHG